MQASLNAREHDVPVKRAWMVAGAIILVVVVGLAIRGDQPGIGSQPSGAPTTSGAPSASSPASAAPTTEPSLPAPSPIASMRPGKPTSATAEESGIRITLALDRDRIAYGERVWADVLVANTGTDTLDWGHSGSCPFTANVALVADHPVEFGVGRDDWGGDLGLLKGSTLATDFEAVPLGEPVAGFTPEPWVDLVGNFGCTTDLVVDQLAPGDHVAYRAAWDAEGPHEVPLAPGPYAARATFHHLGRGCPLEPIGCSGSVEVAVPLEVDSPHVDYLGGGEAMDVIFEDPLFLQLLGETTVQRWDGATLHFEEGAWVLRVYLDAQDRAIVASVNAITGQVLSVVLDEDPGEMLF
jgi:hypothetical protein